MPADDVISDGSSVTEELYVKVPASAAADRVSNSVEMSFHSDFL